jgi:hypothetical protein
MKKVMAAAASLLLIAGQAAAATSDIAATTTTAATPASKARAINHCDAGRKTHAVSGRVTNRCELGSSTFFGGVPGPFVLGALVIGGSIVFGVAEDSSNKPTSP